MDLDDLRVILAAELGVPPDDVSSESSADTLPNWDSLTQLRIIARIEAVTGVTFGQAEADSLTSVPALLDYISQKRAVSARPRMPLSVRSAQFDDPFPDPEFPILVIGDSLVRMFAYDPRFIALLAQRGKDFNVLTDETLEKSQTVFDYLAARVEAGTQVVFARLGDCLHHGLDTYGTHSALNGKPHAPFMMTLARRYVDQVTRFRDRTHTSCAIMAVPTTPKPRVSQSAALFNAALEQICPDSGLDFIGLPQELLDGRGIVKWSLMADEAHPSHHTVPLFEPEFERAGLTLRPGPGAHRPRPYMFRFDAPGGRMSVWGDCPEAEMNREFAWPEFPFSDFGVGTTTAPHWNTQHEATHRAFDAMRTVGQVLDCLRPQTNDPVLVIDAKDGFLPQALTKTSEYSVLAVDRDPLSTGTALILQRLSDVSRVKAITVTDYRSLDELGPVSATVIYDRPRIAGDYLRLLLDGPLSSSPIVFLRTASREAAVAAFRGSGFAAMFDVPLYGSNWPDAMIREQNEVLGGLFKATHYEGLICASRAAISPAIAQDLSAAFEQAAQAHVNTYVERVSSRLSSIRRGLAGLHE